MNRTVLVLRLREYAALNDGRWSLQRAAADAIEFLETENAQLAATIKTLTEENNRLRMRSNET